MLLLLIFLIAGSTAFGQSVLQDWKCGFPTNAISKSVGGAQVTDFTCPKGHSFAVGSTALLAVSGATGTWAGMNTKFLPMGDMFGHTYPSNPYTASFPDSNTIRIPYNSSQAGPFTGQRVQLRRTHGDQDFYGRAYPGESWSLSDELQPDETLRIIVPGCPDPSDGVSCAKKYTAPNGGKYPGINGTISSFACSGSTCTITLTAPFNGPPPFLNLQTGSNIWIRGMNNAQWNGARTYNVTSVNGNATSLTIKLPNGFANDTSFTPGNAVININYAISPYVYFESKSSAGMLYPYSKGFTQGFVQNGGFDPNSNRIRFWTKWGVTQKRLANNADDFQFGSYFKTANDPDTTIAGGHPYHYSSISMHAGKWAKIEVNRVPTHTVGGIATVNYPEDFTYTGHIYPSATHGGPRHYLDALESFYLDYGNFVSMDISGGDVYVGRIEMDRVPNEPEELVQSRIIQYTDKTWLPSDTNTPTGPPGYELFWTNPKYVPVTYQVRFSTTQSLKTQGFSKGLCKSGTTTCNFTAGVDLVNGTNDGYVGTGYTSRPEPTAYPNIWFGIRPIIPVWGTTGAGQNPIWINTRVDVGMQAGDHITVSGVGGNTAANQTNAAIVAVLPRQNWFLTQPASAPPWNTPGDLISIVSDGSTCTTSLRVNHNLFPGMAIQVIGSTNSTLGDRSDMHFYKVASVPDPKRFTFACPGVPAATYNTDYTGTNDQHFAVMSFPAIAVAGPGNGAWTSGGTIVSTEENKNFAEISFSPMDSSPVQPQLTSCDVNSDGVVNAADVTLATNQVLGLSPCRNDLDQDGACTVVDVQRVIAVVNGAACKTGPSSSSIASQ